MPAELPGILDELVKRVRSSLSEANDIGVPLHEQYDRAEDLVYISKVSFYYGMGHIRMFLTPQNKSVTVL